MLKASARMGQVVNRLTLSLGWRFAVAPLTELHLRRSARGREEAHNRSFSTSRSWVEVVSEGNGAVESTTALGVATTIRELLRLVGREDAVAVWNTLV